MAPREPTEPVQVQSETTSSSITLSWTDSLESVTTPVDHYLVEHMYVYNNMLIDQLSIFVCFYFNFDLCNSFCCEGKIFIV